MVSAAAHFLLRSGQQQEEETAMKTLLLALAAASALTLATPCVFAAVPVDVKAALADPGPSPP